MSKDKFRRILYYYVESGIPLSLGVLLGSQIRHSIIVIGHGRLHIERSQLQENLYACFDKKSNNTVWICDAADAIDEFCIMDDAQTPYKLVECKLYNQYQLRIDKYIIETMMVPLYKRMYLEAGDASEIFKVILASNEYGIRNLNFEGVVKNDGLLGLQENPIVVRIFMTSSRSLRKCRDKQFADGNTEVRAWYSSAIFPKFVWVCELSTVDLYSKKVIGEIILDATSSADAYTDSLIIVHYPKHIFCRLPQDMIKDKFGINFQYEENEDDVIEVHEICEWQPFLPYDSNLYPVAYDE